jgi:hypothetical protein
MNHYVRLKLSRQSRCFTTTTTSSAPQTPSHGQNNVIYHFFYFSCTCLPSYIVGSQDTIECCRWLAGPGGCIINSCYRTKGWRLVCWRGCESMPVWLPGWLPCLKVLTSESPMVKWSDHQRQFQLGALVR